MCSKLFFLLLLFNQFGLTSSMTKSCSGNKEFKLFTYSVNFEEVKQKYHARGKNSLNANTGNLAAIQTYNEQLCITKIISSRKNMKNMMSLLSHCSSGYFIGALSQKAGNTWAWHNGKSVFHKPFNQYSSSKVHALSFLIKERFSLNNNWNNIIKSLNHIRHAGEKVEIEAQESDVRSLLMYGIDKASAIQRFISIHERAFRYRGSLPHFSCTQNVVWTVISSPNSSVFFSTLQFTTVEKGRRQKLVEQFQTNLSEQSSHSQSGKLLDK